MISSETGPETAPEAAKDHGRIDPPGIDALRGRFVDAALLAGAVVGLPALVASFASAHAVGWSKAELVHVAAYLILLPTALARKRLSFRFRSIVIVSLFFVMGVGDLVSRGHLGTGFGFLTSAAVLATVLLGTRSGVTMLVLGLVACAAVATSFYYGVLTLDLEPVAYAAALSKWVSKTGAWALMAAILVACLGTFHASLSRSAMALRRKTEALQRAKDTLENEMAERARLRSDLAWELEVNSALAGLFEPLLSTSASMEEISGTVLDAARGLTNSEHGYVAEIDPRTGSVIGHACTLNPQGMAEVTANTLVHLPTGSEGDHHGLWGHALQTREGFFTNSPRTHPSSRSTLEGHLPIRRFLSVPVILGEDIVGQIALANGTENYTCEDLDAVKRLATVYALGIQRMRAKAELHASNEELEHRVQERTAELDHVNRRLQHANLEWERTFDAVPDLIMILDSGQRIVRANQAMTKTLGVHPREAIGQTCYSIVHGEDAPPRFCPHLRLLEDETERTVELTESRRGATLEVIVSPLRDEDGNLVGSVHVAHDITERKRAECALRESERFLSDIFSSIQDGICILDHTHTIVRVNPAMESRYSHALPLVGKKCFEVLRGRNQTCETCPSNRALRTGEASRGLLPGVERDGNITEWNDLYAFPLLDGGSSRITGVVLSVRDITRQKRAEDQLKAALAEKEILVREIHHRVKNNFQVVAGLLTLQAERMSDPKYVEAFNDTEARIRAMALVHERLHESDSLAEIRIDEYITSIVADLIGVHGIAGKSVRLTTDLKPLHFDPDTAIPCGLIVTELVSNALKHAFPDRTVGEIRLALHALEDDEFELVVSDDGIGINEEAQDPGRNSLGLTLVEALVAKLRGTIMIRSEQGTEFRIIFRKVETHREN